MDLLGRKLRTGREGCPKRTVVVKAPEPMRARVRRDLSPIDMNRVATELRVDVALIRAGVRL